MFSLDLLLVCMFCINNIIMELFVLMLSILYVMHDFMMCNVLDYIFMEINCINLK